MKIEAIVKLGDGVAHYLISREGTGCYRAELVHYCGHEPAGAPPDVTLVRSVRKWTGSVKNQQLLNELGEAIDSVLAGAPIFTKDTDAERTPDKTGSPEA